MQRLQLEVETLRRYLRRSGVTLAALLAAIVVGITATSIAWKRALDADPGHRSTIVLPVVLIAVVSVVVLAVVLLEMRRHLKRQLDHLLHAQELALDQTARLQEQAVELELTVHELKDSERELFELAESERQLNRRLTEAQSVARLGYWEVDSGTGSVYWSDEMYRFVGLEPGIVPPPTDFYLTCVHPDDQEEMQRVAADAVSKGSAFTTSYRLRSPDGSYRTMHAEGHLIDDQGVQRLVGTVQDVTDRVSLEGQLRQAQKMEAVGRLAGGVAHDFNNMLTVVISYAEMARQSAGEDSEMRELMDEILGASDRAAALTRQLLTFSRGRLIQQTVVDLNDVVRDLDTMLRRIVGEDVTIGSHLATDPLPVFADAHQLGQVLMNLAVNARDAMPDGGTIVMRTSLVPRAFIPPGQSRKLDAPRYAVISVCDTGTGMDEETQARIFEPFFTTKPEGHGTGLGLSTTFGIVQQAGGWITVSSQPGHGTTFDIYLPMYAEEERPHAPEEQGDGAGGRVMAATVLVVEDDALVRRTTVHNLARLGYTVLDAADGVAALELLATQQVDLVITDTVMPNMSGPELARLLAEEQPTLPVVLTSGYTPEAIQPHGPIPDVVALLEKPFSATTLDEVVQRGLKHSTRRPS